MATLFELYANIRLSRDAINRISTEFRKFLGVLYKAIGLVYCEFSILIGVLVKLGLVKVDFILIVQKAQHFRET